MGKLKNNRASPERGLTLIGVLVATLVFSIILIATAQLMARSEKNIGTSREQFVATNLAREGLELAQYVRDSNWLAPAPRPDWFSHPAEAAGATPLCADGRDHTITIEPDDVIGAKTSDTTPGQLYVNANGEYTHDPTGGTLSGFGRKLIIICSQRFSPNNEHIEILSHVTWFSRGRLNEVSLATRLYNWRQ